MERNTLVFSALFLSLFAISSTGALSLQEKVSRLSEMSQKNPIIVLNTVAFKELVKAPPRNYSVILMLTALDPRRACAICRAAADEYEVVANSWLLSTFQEETKPNIFFALADFDYAEEVFQLLNKQSAPIFMHIPANGKQVSQDTLNIQKDGFEAEVISKWVQERTGVQVRIVRKPNYAYLLALSIFFCFCAGIVYIRQSTFSFLWNRQIYANLVVLLIIYFLSGQMWNHIRGPPLMTRNPQTKAYVWIAGSTQSQFLLETYVVMGVLGLASLGFILLIEAGKKVPEGVEVNKARNNLFAMIGGGFVFFFFSMLISIFRAKFQGYPYRMMFN